MTLVLVATVYLLPRLSFTASQGLLVVTVALSSIAYGFLLFTPG
jgi:hypothetical protein